ncbi:MAG: hypothetical protein ABIF77_10055 [bacterium]
MLTCREVHRLVATGEIENAGLWQKLSLRLHLMMCVNCRRYGAQLEQLSHLARTAFGPRPGDEAILDRLRHSILAGLPDAGGEGGSNAPA